MRKSSNLGAFQLIIQEQEQSEKSFLCTEVAHYTKEGSKQKLAPENCCFQSSNSSPGNLKNLKG